MQSVFHRICKTPRNDSIWKIKKIKVISHDHKFCKENKVDTDLTTKIVETVCDLKERENFVFIVVTGDSDFMPPIKSVLDRIVQVELWSWKHSMSAEFKTLKKPKSLDDLPEGILFH